MLLLNYAHPLTADQMAPVTTLLGTTPTVRTIATQVDRSRPLAEVARALADAAHLAPEEWQTVPLLVNPPGLAPLAVALLAELHGRCGYFPAILNIRPVAGTTPPRFEVAEVIDVQAVREAARTRRRQQEHTP